MTDSEMNIALAEFEGCKYHKPTEEELKSGSYYQYEPDYGSSLDACHRVEVKLDHDKYTESLITVLGAHRFELKEMVWMVTTATAPQRREALCRTLFPERWAERREA